MKSARKAVIIGMMTAMMVIAFTSCRGKAELEGLTEDGILAANEVVDFYFYYPENFKIDQNAAMISVYAEDNETVQTDITSEAGSYGVNVNPNLSVTAFGMRGGEYTGIEDYWERACIPAYEATFTEMEVTGSEELTIGGALAMRYDFGAKLAGMEYRYTQVILMRQGSVYTITYTTRPDKYEKYVEVLERTLRTFNFK